MSHALLSASSSHRWINCTPSVRLEEQYPDKGSDYAAEGTLAHAICELKLRKTYTVMTQKQYTTALNKLKKTPEYKEEMQGYTDTYVEYIHDITYKQGSIPYVGIEKQVSYDKYASGGFGTADCIIVYGNTIHVIDFKYGQGVPVSAENNSQLMLYAIGAVESLFGIYDIKQVNLAVIQPRLNITSEWTTTTEELVTWAETVIKPAAQKALLGLGEYVPGGHCKFCRAKHVCRARADANLKLADMEFKKPPTLTNTEVGQALIMGQHLKAWLSDLEEYALQAVLAGEVIDGWKAVEGRSNRAFSDADEAFKVVVNSGIDEALLYERKPITLTGVEKLIGKKTFDDLLGSMIVKSQGKPTLVLESDTREPYKLATAKQEFGGIKNG